MPPPQPLRIPSSSVQLLRQSRPQPQPPQRSAFSTTTCRPARLLRRPKRPYTFTQLITLSDGSTYTHRTTSPLAVYRSAKDVRNTPLWNPSNVKMANVEEDEAGRLAGFRRRFGRGWDARSEALGTLPGAEDQERDVASGEAEAVHLTSSEGAAEGATTVQDGVGVRVQPMERGEQSEGRQGRDKEGRIQSESGWSDQAEENLMDLIGSYGGQAQAEGSAANVRMATKGGKKGKGKR